MRGEERRGKKERKNKWRSKGAAQAREEEEARRLLAGFAGEFDRRGRRRGV